MALLPGYERDRGSGKAQRYLSPTGESISRREYENRRVITEGGWKDYKVYQKFYHQHIAPVITGKGRQDANFNRFLDGAIRNSGATTKEEQAAAKKELLQPGSSFLQQYRDTFYTPDGKRKRADKSATGPLAKLMEESGMRKVGEPWAVGDTPKGGGHA